MKNKFLSYGTCRRHRVWQVLMTLVFLFTLSIGQMWAADFTPAQITASGGTTTSNVKVSSPLSTTSAKVCNETVTCVSIGASANGNYDAGYVEIQASSGYTLDSPIDLSCSVNKTDDGTYKAVVVFWTGEASATYSDYTEITLRRKDATTDCGPIEIAVPSNTRTVRIYRNLKVKDGSVSGASGCTTLGSGQTTYIKQITASATSSGGGCSAPTDPAISGTTAYTEGDDISLTASATGATSATFTWYKGADWATASAGSSVGTGATLAINSCATSDAGTYWCNISNGTGCEVQVSKAITVAAAPAACPAGLTISGTAAYTEGQTISLNAALSEGNGEITYNWYKGADLATAKAAGSIGTGTSFSKASCAIADAGNYWCVASKDACPDAESAAYAVTVAAVSYCAELYPATTGSSPSAANQEIILQTESPNASYGGKIYTHSKKSTNTWEETFTYTSKGLQLNKSGDDKVRVELNHLLAENTVITVNMDWTRSDDKSSGVILRTGDDSQSVKTMTKKNPSGDFSDSYTIQSTDTKLIGSNSFILARSNSIGIKSITVSNCGAELHALTSAIDPAAAEGKATITLSKTLVAAGATATATYSAIDAAYDFDEWVVSGATIDDAKANPVTITMGSTDAVITLKLKAASVKHTVTYYDGEAIPANKLGEELVNEGGNPTGAGLAPKKHGYTFGGWSLTNGGAAISAYTDVTVNEDKDLFVVWTPVVCPTSGVIFSAIADPAKAPGSDYQIAGNTRADLATYATISGGSAVFGNADANQYITIKSSTSKIALSGSNMRGYVKVTMDCDLEEGDIIRIADNSNKFRLAFDSTGTVKNDVSSGNHDVLIDADRKGKYEFFIYRNGNDVNFGSIQVLRPYTVSFNLNGQSATAIDDQKIIAGGKVTKPTDPVVEGQAFGGWFTDNACTAGNEWDFANDVVNDDVELFAKWTALPKLILNRGAATTGDNVVSYPTVGNPVAVPACPFTYAEHVFSGWVYSPAVTVEDGSFNMPNEDLTLTAQWVDASSVARIGSNYYATLADALAHAADGEIVLLQDINVEAQVEIADGVSATIDLAGHKIEYTSATTLPSGVILVHNGGSLTINDSSDPDAGSVVAGEKAYAALMLTKAGDDASKVANLVINGGIFTGNYYAISGNGSRPNTSITINGGTFTATATNDNLAIYHPQNGTLTINGGLFTGYLSAIEMRAGTLVINDGSFTATALTFSCNPNGAGTTTQGAAIAIAQHTTKKDISVTINGGTFNGVKALNESNPQANDPAPQVTMAVTAGTFTGEVTTVDVNHFVSGGTFSTPVAESQCAAGYVPETKPNGKYGVIYPAQSIDFMAIIDAKGTGDEGKAELDNQLSTKHYDIDGTLNDDRLEAGGFKVKKTGLTISFSVEKAKVVEITTGHISGASIKVNDAAAVAMESDKKHSYYSDDAQAFLITMTAASNAYNIFKSIVIRDPYQVAFNANGGDPVASQYAKPSVTLPSAVNGTKSLVGWFDAATGGTKVGDEGDAFTPTKDTTLFAQWEEISTDARLASITLDPSTGVLEPAFDPELVNYTYTMPYGTAAVPQITGATAVNAGGSYDIVSQAAAWGETAVIRGVAASSDTKQYNITMLQAPKDPLCIIKAEHDGTSTGATVTGYYGGTKDKVTYDDGKLGQENRYFGIKLAEEAGTFKAGDVLKIYATNPSAAVRIYSDKGTTRINAEDGTFDSEKMFTYTLTENEEWIYLYRRYKAAETDMNPTLGYMAVYRPVPNPLVKTITFNGAAGVIDNTASPKTITVEVPASTDIATMPVVATFYSNDPSQTSGAVTGGTWAEGTNEYIVTDKDNDQTVYTVTITKAEPSSDATLATLTYGTPATAIALADGVYEYDVLLPYGTSAVPALAATVHHAGATIEEIDNATAFVDRKATSTVTVKAEDNTTTQVYTVTFIVDRYETTVLWDASVNDNLSQLTGCTTAGISVSDADDVEFEGKTYGKKALSFGGKTKNDRYLGIQIPNGKVAKVSIVYKSRGTSARSIMLATTLASAIDEQTIVYATAGTQDLARMTADIFAGGTIYINTTDGFYVYEIDVQFADGHGRSAMLGAGVYGTVCVPNNVAVEDIQGVTVYELMGREPEYGKLAFDEIVSGELEAGVPYVFQASRNHMALLYGEESVAEPVDKGNGMYGTFSAITLTELDDVYYFAQRALWGCADLTSLSVPANRAYVKLSEIDYLPSNSAPAPGRRRITMTVNGQQVVTGIDNLNAGDQPVKVMIDGQMYILRGEKMYDATGRLVK